MSRTILGRWTVAALCAALLPVVPAATAAASPRPPAPPSDAKLAREADRHDLTREQFYFVLPDRFANGDASNDRGGLTGSRLEHGYDPTDKGFYQGGDLKGLTQRLDYIKGLGTTAIWMAPIFKNRPVQGTGKDASAGYHGYWITDFTQVDPHFGTNADLEKLIDKAHAKGMKVFFDVITNHTADTVDHAEKAYGYKPKGAFPYLDEDGRPFDDRDGVKKVDRDSFPYTPVQAPGTGEKVPSWLNDPTMYHNRGDSTWAGESNEYGDFSGLDDLWTERPEVVKGMAKIYEKWVRDFDIDGFRIDTVKHVDLDFWTQWATALDAYAAKRGRDDFFMFGEVYSADTEVTSPYVTRGRLDSTLDFPFQDAARQFASQGAPADKLASVYGNDYRYTTDKANAYEQVTFLGNHDMGRIGTFLKQDNPKADDAELLKRARLANELMFLGRGNPVIYYGDEQGFTGAGGDKDSRQTLFASKTADYLDDDQLGTDRTHASDAYDTKHPVYRSIAALSKLTETHPALRDGTQIERLAEGSVYATSRIATERPYEYLVASNNGTSPRKVQLATESADMNFRTLYGGSGTARSGKDKKVTVTVPALSSIVLKADRVVAARSQARDLDRGPGRRRHRHRRDHRRRGRRTAQPGRLRRPGGQREVEDARFGRPRPVQGHPVPRRDGAGGHPAALQGCRRRPDGPHLQRPRLDHRRPGPADPEARRRRAGPGRRPLPAPRRRLRGLAAEVRREDRRVHRAGRLRGLRLDRPGEGCRLRPVHRREGRHGRRPAADDRPRCDRSGLDRAGQGRADGRSPRGPAAGHHEGRPQLPPAGRELRRLGTAHLGRGEGAHRLVEAAGAHEEGRLRSHLRGTARRRRHLAQLHPAQGRREGPAHRPVPRPRHVRPRGLDARRQARLPAPADRRRRGPRPRQGRGAVARRGHRRLEGEGHRRHQPAARVREERRHLRRRRGALRRGPVAAAHAVRAERRAEGEVPAPQGLPGVHRGRPRPGPRPRVPARPAHRHPARRQRRSPRRHRRTDRGHPGRPVREEGGIRRTRPGLPQVDAHALRVGPHRPDRLPRTRRPHPPDEARRPHRRLVGHRQEELAGQALPVRRDRLGPHRPEVGHQQGHRPLLHRPDRRLRPQPRRRPHRPEAGAARLVRSEEARRDPAAGRPDPGAARPRLLGHGPHGDPPG